MKKVLITGATGMIGSLVLDNCLKSQEVSQVISFSRKSSGMEHPKLEEIILGDFTDYSEYTATFKDVDIVFFCIGVYTGQVPEDQFKVITVDYAVSLAEVLKAQSPKATYCLLSGQGADRTEKSRVSFAKYKGMAENRIAEMGLGGFYSFRPGYIYPVTPRAEPNMMYSVSRKLYPILKLFGKNTSIKSTELASVMFNVGLAGAEKEVLENRDMVLIENA